jgi:uncharacterized protein YnzC (UPF0291/DUF896 family)
MEQEKIARINALARKAKTEGLTPEEIAERDVLRKEYIAAFKANLVGQLDAITVVEQDGSKHKLKKK